MIKVHMITPEGLKTGLLPEFMPFREMLDYFHADADGAGIVTNGTRLQGEDLDKNLASLSKDAELTVIAGQKPEEEPQTEKKSGVITFSGENGGLFGALMKVRQALDEAIALATRALGTEETEELPF